MADTAAIETILHELEHNEGIDHAILVSRNGAYIAGNAPQGVLVETFAAMFAVLLGSAENSASDLKESIDSIVVNLESSKLLIVHAGPKALMVLQMPKAADSSGTKLTVGKYIPRIEENL